MHNNIAFMQNYLIRCVWVLGCFVRNEHHVIIGENKHPIVYGWFTAKAYTYIKGNS